MTPLTFRVVKAIGLLLVAFALIMGAGMTAGSDDILWAIVGYAIAQVYRKIDSLADNTTVRFCPHCGGKALDCPGCKLKYCAQNHPIECRCNQ